MRYSQLFEGNSKDISFKKDYQNLISLINNPKSIAMKNKFIKWIVKQDENLLRNELDTMNLFPYRPFKTIKAIFYPFMKDVYNIDVDKFNEYLKDSDYSTYKNLDKNLERIYSSSMDDLSRMYPDIDKIKKYAKSLPLS